MEDVKWQRLRQERRQKSAEGFYYRRVFRGDEVVDRSVLKELKPTAKAMVRREAEGRNITTFYKTQRKKC